MTRAPTAADVTIRDAAPIHVAVMNHQGDPAAVDATVERFIAWRKAHFLHPRDHTTFNVFHTDLRTTPPDAFRMDLCVATDRIFASDGHGIAAGIIPGGRYAVLCVTGGSAELEAAALFLHRDWLPASGEEADDFPLTFRRYEGGGDLLLKLKRRA